MPLPTAVAEKGPAPLTESAEMCGVGKNWFLWRFREGKTRKSTIIHSFMMFHYLIMFHAEIAKRSWYISYSDKCETQEFDPPWLAPSSKSRRSRKLSSSAAALSLPWSQRCLPHRQFDHPGFFWNFMKTVDGLFFLEIMRVGLRGTISMHNRDNMG